MFYLLENGRLRQVDTNSLNGSEEQSFLGIISYDEVYSTADGLGIKNKEHAFINRVPRFESHDGFDFICVELLNHEEPTAPAGSVFIYLKDNLLLFICDEPQQAKSVIQGILEGDAGEMNFGRLLCAFFDRLTEKDFSLLDTLEQEITDLEDALLTAGKRSCVKEIVSLHKRLMVLKRYYEHLYRILEGILENENEVLDSRALRLFKILSGRSDRLYHSILNLRDYVTQVREAYQAEVDISLNSTMKLFTVVTTIFLPLTLIVGWYGMNLNMPEYHWAFGYPLVALLSLAVVGICVWIFKRKKWF